MSGVLTTRRVEKVWGRQALPEPFANPGTQPVGEVWFEPPAAFDALLVKYIFTSQKLSVQCHPGNDDVPKGQCGKEECWYILDAEPDAALAIGLDRDVTTDTLRQSARDGSIEDLLRWHTVAPGDFFYLPAGTIHAIGPGISLIEVQQNCDTTYRLYDYGRPRELHLEQALRVAIPGPYDAGLYHAVSGQGSAILADGPPFRVERIAGTPDGAARERFSGAGLIVPLKGRYNLAGEPLVPGGCGWFRDLAEIEWSAGRLALLATPVS